MFINDLFGAILSKYPVTLVDIGAGGGIEPPWNLLDKNLEVIGFEPDTAAFDALTGRDSRIAIEQKYMNTALNNENSEIDFHITRRRGHSSVFEPDKDVVGRFSFPERYDVLETRKIVVKRLDEALQDAGIVDADFIKLDTQGSELAILQGGERTLSRCFGAEVEVEFLPLYKSQPLFSELETCLRDYGFELFDIKRHYEKRVQYRDLYQVKGQLVCGDALFLKNCKRFMKDIATGDAEKAKARILKSIAICHLYRLIDYALEITEQAFEQQYLTEREKEIIDRELRLSASGRNVYQKIRGLLGLVAGEVLKLVKAEKPGGSYDDQTLGNIKR